MVKLNSNYKGTTEGTHKATKDGLRVCVCLHAVDGQANREGEMEAGRSQQSPHAQPADTVKEPPSRRKV